MLSKCSTTELHPSPILTKFLNNLGKMLQCFGEHYKHTHTHTQNFLNYVMFLGKKKVGRKHPNC
jgi:hypothetical protein